MYTLRNKFGNVYKTVNNEREREELLKQGYEIASATTKETDLDKMTDKQLEAYAKAHNIDLKDCKNKADKLAKIKEAESE